MPIAIQVSSRRPLARRYWAFAIPLVVGLAAFGWSRASYFLGAVVDAPATVDLGLHDNNKLVLTDVTIRNAGYRSLDLWDFRGSCPSCLTFGLPSDAGLVEVEQISVPPRGSVTLSVRMLVHGTPDGPSCAAISCATNDPHRPQVTIMFEAAVKGWVFASPPEIDVGTLTPGQTIRRTVEIRDSGRGEPCHFGRLQSPAPDQVKLTLSPTRNNSGADSRQGPINDLIATLDIEITAPATAWEIDKSIAIYETDKDQPLLTIPTRGRVLPKVQVTPVSIVLPRMVRDAADFSAECCLASTAGRALRVTPIDLPPEITVTPVTGDIALGCARYRLEWRAERRPPRGRSGAVTVRFRAEIDGNAEIITVPVRCRGN
jgi:hypothetical protein